MSASKRSLMQGTTWMRVGRANISATLSAGAPILRHYSHLAGGATTIPIAWEGAWEGLRGAYHGHHTQMAIILRPFRRIVTIRLRKACWPRDFD